MPLIERLAPGQVLARISFDDCLRPRPRRPMPADVAAWALALPVPETLHAIGLAGPMREAVGPLWAAVLSRFRQGLRIESGEHAPVVVHCDTVRYELTPRRRVHARMPALGGGYQGIPVEVGTPFPSWTWVRLLAMREPEAVAPLMHSIHVRRLAGMMPANPQPGGLELQALAWLADTVEGLARRCIDGLRMREHLRRALALDPALLSAARRARPRDLPKQDICNDWWNRCIEHRELLLEVQALAPGLLPIVGQLVWAGKVSPHLRNVDFLRQIIDDKLTRSDWRRLSRESPRPVWAMYRNGSIRSFRSLRGFLACWARLHRGLPTGMRMPLAMFDSLARTWVGPLADHTMPPVRWPGTPAATRQAIERYFRARARGEGGRFVEDEWGPVVRWAADYAGTGRSPVGHWSTLKRLAAEDERRVRAGLAGKRWPCPLPRFEDERFAAIAICTGEALADEAIAMRHCADRLATKCADGNLQVYSLRDRFTGKRLASVSIEIRHDGAELAEVARSLNRKPDADELAFAGKLAKSLSQQIKSQTESRARRTLPVPASEAKAMYMERKDSTAYAFVEPSSTGWKGYRVQSSGEIREILGSSPN